MAPQKHSRRVARSTLVTVAFAILFGSFLVAKVVEQWPPDDPKQSAALVYDRKGHAEGERQLIEHLRATPHDADGWRLLVERRGLFDFRRAQFEKQLQSGNGVFAQAPDGAESLLDEEAFLAFVDTATVIPPYVLRAWHRLCATQKLDEGLDALFRALPPDPNDLVEAAEMAHFLGRFETALTYFSMAESVFPQDPAVVGGLLDVLARLKMFDELQHRLARPHQRSLASDEVLIDDALYRRDLPDLVYRLTKADFAKFSLPIFVGVVVAALCWFFFLFFLGEMPSWPHRRKLYALVAPALGVGSAIVTLAVAVVQDDMIGHAERVPSDPYLFTYFVLGVGFREELIKLLFFAPLAPLLVKAVPIERLLIASLVGLGFAAQENAVYFADGGGAVVLARFLTANFFHLALTGLAGFSLVRALEKGGEAWMEFTATFFTMVLLHGAYDFLLTTRMLGGGMSYFAMTVFVYVAQRFLRDVRGMMHIYGTRLAMPLVFTVCLCMAVGVNFSIVSLQVGTGFALRMMFMGLLGNAIIAYMFFREFSDEVV